MSYPGPLECSWEMRNNHVWEVIAKYDDGGSEFIQYPGSIV